MFKIISLKCGLLLKLAPACFGTFDMINTNIVAEHCNATCIDQYGATVGAISPGLKVGFKSPEPC